jgi:L-alanine-DL-glutamate epimerase-like enolase superfamily enzyme
MKITKIETLRFARGTKAHAGTLSWLWVRIHTDEGLVGLGETYPAAEASEAVLRGSLAPVLLGRDPGDIEKLWADMFLAVSYAGWAGAELRAISAVDLALWDLLGKKTGLPVYRLLGGRSRDAIRPYNTCYDLRFDFNQDPELLAKDLLDMGIRAMKVWPFDKIALKNGGQFIRPEELQAGLAPIRRIRESLGDSMEIAVEFHGYWNLPTAAKIAKALEPLNPMWLEEMLPQDNLDAYASLKSETRIPLALSERWMTRWQFREALARRIPSVVNPDLCWVGGLTEAKKIAAMAEAEYIPVAPHNCGGPVLHFASMHLAASLVNLQILETVRTHYLRDWKGLVTDLGEIRNGSFFPPERPGLGVELDPSVWRHPDATVSVTGA